MATENARAIEAIIMVAEQPVAPELLAQLLEINLDEVEAIANELMASYEVEDRGFILTRIAGGFRFQSHPDQAAYVERFVLEGQTARLSAAALETLAIVAYKQPLSRAQVAAIRGVNVDGVIRTLEQRGYIAEVGRDPGPGNPILFGTTDVFLDKLGINALDDLPPIASFVPGPDVVEQLEQGLRAEIDLDVQAELGAEGDPDGDATDATDATDAAGAAGRPLAPAGDEAVGTFGHPPVREPEAHDDAPRPAFPGADPADLDALPEDEPLAADAPASAIEDAQPEDGALEHEPPPVVLDDLHPEDPEVATSPTDPDDVPAPGDDAGHADEQP